MIEEKDIVEGAQFRMPKLTKKQRHKVFDKYAGKCAYCGCELGKGWHVDHKEAIVRNYKYSSEKGWIPDGTCRKPENEAFDNLMPACPSCNRQKHSQSLEGFRQSIAQFVNSLNLYHNQYKFAKRYGLVEETGKPVVFYFEKQDVHSVDLTEMVTPGIP